MNHTHVNMKAAAVILHYSCLTDCTWCCFTTCFLPGRLIVSLLQLYWYCCCNIFFIQCCCAFAWLCECKWKSLNMPTTTTVLYIYIKINYLFIKEGEMKQKHLKFKSNWYNLYTYTEYLAIALYMSCLTLQKQRIWEGPSR